MFSSPISSPTNRSAFPRPFHSNQCHPERSEGSAFRLSPLSALSVSAFSSPDVSSFNSKLSTACPERSRRVNFPSLSPFLATLTDESQPTENSATLSLVVATLTSRVNHNPFVCHSYKKYPGWEAAIVNFFVAQTSVCALLRQSTSERSEANDPQELKNRAVRPIPSYESPLTASALFLPPVTGHQSQITNPFTIRTYEKRARNSRRIRTSKTRHLKSFRMNTYEKTPGGAHPQASVFSFLFIPACLKQGRSERPKGARILCLSRATDRGSPNTEHGPKIHESPIASHGISPCYTPARLRKRISQFLARTSRRQPIS